MLFIRWYRNIWVGARQAANDNMAERCMLDTRTQAYAGPVHPHPQKKDTHTHRHVIFCGFLLQQWFCESSLVYSYMYIVRLVLCWCVCLPSVWLQLCLIKPNFVQKSETSGIVCTTVYDTWFGQHFPNNGNLTFSYNPNNSLFFVMWLSDYDHSKSTGAVFVPPTSISTMTFPVSLERNSFTIK